MTVAFSALVALIVLIPALAVAGSKLACGIASAIAAVGIIGASLALPSREIRQFSQTLKPIVVASLLAPCIWMLIQILPLGGRPLTNSIWVSASSALGHPLAGTITIDTGETILALARYITAISVVLLSVVVALDRQRAVALLVLSTLVTVGMSAGFIAIQLDWEPNTAFDHLTNRADITAIVVIGIVLSAAVTVRSYEKTKSPRYESSRRLISLLTMIASLASLMVCSIATLMTSHATQFAGLIGMATVASVFAIRKWRLGRWGQFGLAATAVVTIVAFIAASPGNGSNLTIGLADQRSGAIERMLSDARWNGSGAGTFDALAPIYRDLDEADVRANSTTAAIVAIEMGWPFLWVCCIALMAGAAILFRCAMLRRQECFYASAGAGCILAFLISSFGTYGTLGASSPVLLSVVSGLAIAQSKSTAGRRNAKQTEPP